VEQQQVLSKVETFVVLNEDIYFDGSLHEFFVRAKLISNLPNPCHERDFVFTPDNFSLSQKGLIVAHAIVNPQDDFIPVRVIKPEYGIVVLKRGTRIGRLEDLNSAEGFFEDIRMCGLQEDKVIVCQSLSKAQVGELPEDHRRKLMLVLREFKDVFSNSKMDIGCTPVIEHQIDTEDASPIAEPPRRIPMALEEKVDHLVKELLKNDIIQPSESPWNAPIVIVAKKNGDIRMCVDYRKLNSVTKKPIYPIPSTQQLMDCLTGSMYFSTLDLSQGYHQIPMASKDIQKTAFATRLGHFEYKRMPFGLATAPATFQRLMHIVLRNENWHKCLIYLDDIIIFGRNAEEHLDRLRSILQRIREANLKLSLDKCTFMKTRVSYLGHIVTSSGIETDPSKIEKITQWPTPKTIKQLRSFLGLCGYYRRFIKNYTEIVGILDKLCCSTNENSKKSQNITMKWNEAHENAFIQLKSALTSTPVLAYPDDNSKFILDTDASNTGIGAVLSQLQNGEEKVIAYGPRRLMKFERRYCATRKELLAVVFFVRHFKHYLFGRRFVVRTVHKALLWMLNWQKPNTSQYCLWKAELELYEMEVIHRPGIKHINADALSRLPSCSQCNLKHLDPAISRHMKVFSENSSESTEETQPQEHVCIVNKSSEQNVSNNWEQEADSELSLLIKLMKNGQIYQSVIPTEIRGSSCSVKELWRQRKNLRLRDDVLNIIHDSKYKIIVPQKKRSQLIQVIHSSIGHAGIAKVLHILQDHYYWPGLSDDTKIQINQCAECQLMKNNAARIRAPLQPTIVGEPFERIAIDISGPFHHSKHGHRYIMAVIDYFSKFLVLIPLRRIDTETIARKLFHHWITIFGVPLRIHTDRGTNFESDLFQSMCSLLGIKKTRTSPYYPQSDGLVERVFRTIKLMISAVVKERQISWCETLPIVEMGLRASIQDSIGFSPFEVLFGRKMRLPWMWQYPNIEKSNPKQYPSSCQYLERLKDILRDVRNQVEENMKIARQRQAEYYNLNKMCKPFAVGDKVLIKVERNPPASFPLVKYVGPYVVIQELGHMSYELQHTINKKVVQRNFNQLKKWNEINKEYRKEAKTISTSILTASHKKKKTSQDQRISNESHPYIQSRQTSLHDNATTPRRASQDHNHNDRIEHHQRYPLRTRGPPNRLGFSL